MNKQSANKTKGYIENSIGLRISTSLLAILGIIAASSLSDCPLWITLLSLVGCILGSYYSYKNRFNKNIIGKICISLGIIFVAMGFFRDLLLLLNTNVSDARIPLTNMLIALQGLHSFDLPRRRDLSLSSIVGFILLASAATLSRDLYFGLIILLFTLFAIIMLWIDTGSRTHSRAYFMANKLALSDRKSGIRIINYNTDTSFDSSTDTKNFRSAYSTKTFNSLVIVFGIFIITQTLIFCFIPRFQFLYFKNMHFAANLNLSFLQSSGGQNLLNISNNDGSIKSNPEAYFGFAESLDTNFRAKLSDQIVLRVASPNGYYLRGMAYDQFDGRVWRMTKPKETNTLSSSLNNTFNIASLKSLSVHNIATDDVFQTVYVESEGSNLIACASIPYQLHFPSQTIQIDSYGSLRSPVGIHKDMVYTVFSRVPILETKELLKTEQIDNAKLQKIKNKFANYLEIDPHIPKSVSLLAKEIAGGGNNFEQATKLSHYLQSKYKYDLDIEPLQNKKDTVSAFLFDSKKGYCEQFASAQVILCRCLGIPARLVTGYTPGQYNPFTGLWEIKLSDAHAWAEIYLPKRGWIPIDSTPVGVGGFSNTPSSVSQFLNQELINFFNKLNESTEMVKLKHLIEELLIRIFDFFDIFAGYLSTTLSIIIALLLLNIYRIMKPKISTFSIKHSIFRSPANLIQQILKTRTDTKFSQKNHFYRDQKIQQIQKEYFLFLDSLRHLGLSKDSKETNQEFLHRLKEYKPVFFNAECQNKLELFISNYEKARFGKLSLDEIEDTRSKLNKLLKDFKKDIETNNKTSSFSI